MNWLLILLVTVLVIWMLLCARCGYHLRLIRFLGVLIGGLALNMGWMVFALKAHPFEPNALVAQASAVLYAITAFGSGWLVGRLVRQWRASGVETHGV